MSGRALVIGGAGRVGAGLVRALEGAGWGVTVVDPAGGGIAERAGVDLLDRVGPVDLVVISLPARGEGREVGAFRPAAVAAAELPGRLAALELALGALDGGVLVELAGSALLDRARDEASLIAGWQRGIHAGLDSVGARAILCSITGYVDPEGPGIGPALLEIVAGGRGGICRLDPGSRAWEWVD
jgi:hypothetical protein